VVRNFSGVDSVVLVLHVAENDVLAGEVEFHHFTDLRLESRADLRGGVLAVQAHRESFEHARSEPLL